MIDYYHAEVVEDPSTYLWDKDKTDQLFSIAVKWYSNKNPHSIKNVIPWNNSIKQIPIIGETVLVFRGDSNLINPEEEGKSQWYYIGPINIQSSICNHQSPTTSNGDKKDEEFEKIVKNKPISPLQPYRGDLLYEGRWGNSIRLGSTIEFKDNYHVEPSWNQGNVGDPIIILANGQENKTQKEFIVENAETDNSSLYLTSTQEINNLNLNISKYTEYNSQFIGVADRVVLKAQKDIIVLDTKKAIVLNIGETKGVRGHLLIGDDQADTPLVHGDVLKDIFDDLLTVLEAGVVGGGLASSFILTPNLQKIRSNLNKLNSKYYKIKK